MLRHMCPRHNVVEQMWRDITMLPTDVSRLCVHLLISMLRQMCLYHNVVDSCVKIIRSLVIHNVATDVS